MKPSILVSHPFGNANVRQAALAFAENDALLGFRTCINWNQNSPLASLFSSNIRSQLARRTFPALVSDRTKTRPFRELARLTSTRFGWEKWTAHETGRFSVDAIFRDLDAAVAREISNSARVPSAVYAYEDGACATFIAAKKKGIRRLYDLPIGYWQEARSIHAEEAERQPEWAATLTAMTDSPEKLARKDVELDLADTVYVASHYTASTLTRRERVPDIVRIIPYGCPPPQSEPVPSYSGPLRVLFVGSLGQRKGTSYLLSAIAMLGSHVTLTLLGSRPPGRCQPLDLALKTHRWIPSLPHSRVLQEMRQHDVLVFPSLFEGFGLVILEALSQGVPVITTPHTGGPDVLTEGEDGYIVPIRDSNAIVEKLSFLLENPDHLKAMKSAALRKAQMVTWEKYRAELAGSVLNFLA